MGTRRTGDWLRRLRRLLSRSRDGDRRLKKGASPQQYVEGLNGETARHSRIFALGRSFMDNAGWVVSMNAPVVISLTVAIFLTV